MGPPVGVETKGGPWSGHGRGTRVGTSGKRVLRQGTGRDHQSAQEQSRGWTQCGVTGWRKPWERTRVRHGKGTGVSIWQARRGRDQMRDGTSG
eukprot:4320383-Ditylum_brightwellii.AAC.1